MTTNTVTSSSISHKVLTILRYIAVIAALYMLIAAVNILSSALSFTVLPDSIMHSLESPFFAIAAGMVITILLQSSSASTAVIIALSASDTIDLTTAVFLVMGANIGTTITNSAVALGYVRDKKMFATTFSAGTVHDFFNLFAVILFGLLEYFTSLLSQTAAWLSDMLYNYQAENLFTLTFLKVSDWVSGVFNAPANLLESWNVHSLVMGVLSIVCILGSIAVLTKMLKRIQKASEENGTIEDEAIYKPAPTTLGQIKAILSGAATTALVQSSSITTSAAVVGVGTEKYTIRDIYPFIAGANIGTTLTALLVAFMTGSEAALSVALAHVLFNVFGVIVLFTVPVLNDMPLQLSGLMEKIVQKRRLFAAIYIGGFIAVPSIILFLS